MMAKRPCIVPANSSDASPAVIEVLLAAGADVNARDEVGGTPLQNAAGIYAGT